VRTPAEAYFPKNLWSSFALRLGQYGLRNFGCASITSPWLSYYVEGCEQKLHADVPHGPLAFVFSISPKKIRFKGGSTILLKETTLDYWPHFASASGREYDSLVKEVEPKFNRLVVFDPRVPHGVSPVEGVKDPREARLVIHGWFTKPEPYVEGALKQSRVRQTMAELYDRLNEYCRKENIAVDGLLSLRLFVRPNGKVSKAQPFFSTLRGASEKELGHFAEGVVRLSQEGQFPSSSAPSRITLPLHFSQ
jgi:hypothetical protein